MLVKGNRQRLNYLFNLTFADFDNQPTYSYNWNTRVNRNILHFDIAAASHSHTCPIPEYRWFFAIFAILTSFSLFSELTRHQRFLIGKQQGSVISFNYQTVPRRSVVFRGAR